MPAIGITGGISSGKSTFCRCLTALVPTAKFFDADKAARLLADTDTDVRREIGGVFGQEIYSNAGDLNRAQVRAIILHSPGQRRALEQILHPRIRSQWSAEAQIHRNSSEFFFADIPLLYETGGERLCDRVVVVACSPAVQLRRLLQRGSAARVAATPPRNATRGAADGLDSMRESEAIQLIKTQMSMDEKIGRADHVVWNNNGAEVLAEQARDLVNLWRAKTWTPND